MSELIQKEDGMTEIATIPNNPRSLLQIAVERGADVEQLSKLMDLQERWDRESARKAFYASRAKFQSICPTINKDREVAYGQTKYKYATLAGIVQQVREPMSLCGLTYRWEIANHEGGAITVTCFLSHLDGHTEQNPMMAFPDDSGAKNAIQQLGSTVSYLERYTLIGALGIASAVEDDDGASTGATNVERLVKHMALVREHFDTIAAIKDALAIDDYDVAIEARNELTDDDIIGLNLAPSKGGIFTTEERGKMKSNDWSDARNARAESSNVK